MSIDAMKLALEALEPDVYRAEWAVEEDKQKAITALRQAIEQAEGEDIKKPLTDKQIGAILDDPNIAEKNQGNWLILPYAYARAIEAAHGITGEKE